MEKTFATIRIVFSDVTTKDFGGSSGTRPTNEEKTDWIITLRPLSDVEIDSTSWADRDAAEATLAHELGHVIARLFKDQTHSDAMQFLANMTDNPSLLVPAEKKAWKLGEAIYPAINKTLERDALASYGYKGKI